MTIALTVLLSLLSLGILAGRIYEILKLTDPQTGFFIYKGIIFNPYILVIFTVITVCCAVLIFGGNKKVKPFFSQSSKIIALASGAMFLVYGVMSAGDGITSVFVIAGGIALVLIGIWGLRPAVNAVNIAVVVLIVVFIAGLCLDVIIFNVSTIHNIAFIKNALSYMAAGLFLLMVMKNVFAPSVYSGMLLYITGIIAFVMCGVMNIADIIAMAVNGQAVLPQLFFNAGFGFFGFFAFDNAISVMPKRIVQADAESESAYQLKQEAIPDNEPATENIDYTQAFFYKEDTAITVADEVKAENNAELTGKSEMAEICDETADVQEEDITTPGCVQEDVKTTARKLVFTKNGDIKELSSKKSSGKVVYKRPKN